MILHRFWTMSRVRAALMGKEFINLQLLKQRSRPTYHLPFNWLDNVRFQRNFNTAISPDTDYETERKTFNIKTPEYYNFARDVIDKWAEKEKNGQRESNNPAFWWINESGDELKWTFQDLSHKSKVVANVLTGPCKLKPNDLLIVILPRIPAWWLINIAAIRAGVVTSPGTILLRSNDIRQRINTSRAKCLITNADCADYVDEVQKDCPTLETKVIVGAKRTGWMNYEDLVARSSDYFKCVNSKASDPMTIFFTSGTSGPPKMTEHTHSSYGLGHLITARYYLELSSNDIIWNLADTGWASTAWNSFFAPWIAGSCVFTQDSVKFDPNQTLKVIHEYPLTTFVAPSTAIRYLVKEALIDVDFTSLRRCCSAGEAVNPELLEEWKEGTGLMIYEGYGQTETTFLCGTYSYIKQKPGSMGKPSPGVDLQIVDAEGNIVPVGQEGEIGLRCKPERPIGLFSRYADDERRTEQSYVGDFYMTGDRAVMDEDGYVWFVGRSDDIIMSAGYRIGPFEVESALLEHPAVLESAVVSSPDPDRGEIVKAFITLTDPYKSVNKEELKAELQRHAKEITAPYKYPRKIEFVEALPKTVSGKIRRVELRSKEWEQSSDITE